jgi:predicted transcriptional regulator
MTLFSKLSRLLWDTTKEFHLQALTESDRMIYMLLVESSVDGKVEMPFDKFLLLCDTEGLSISRAQFYKSLRNLERLGLISRTSSVRGARYLINDCRLSPLIR